MNGKDERSVVNNNNNIIIPIFGILYVDDYIILYVDYDDGDGKILYDISLKILLVPLCVGERDIDIDI